MGRIFLAILFVFCIFSFNTCFNVNEVYAQEATQTQEVKQENTYNTASDDEILDQPVFQQEKQQTTKGAKKITGKLSSVIVKVLGGSALLIIIILCGSFIWIANLQRKSEARKKKLSRDTNVVNAIDNFAKHRIKD